MPIIMYEYTTFLTLYPEEVEKTLNSMARRGWRLISVTKEKDKYLYLIFEKEV